MNFAALHLVHPEWVHGFWLWLAFAALLFWLERRGADRLKRLVGERLEERLVERPARWRSGLRFSLLALAGLLLVVALIRPQWGERFVATPRVGAEIMIALDVSRSMLADDARPSRLERAKAEIGDLLAYLPNDQVGLIAFAGRASVLSPLTPDKSFLRLALESAGSSSVSRGGTRLAEPILRAVAGLGEPGPAQRALLLVTDGEDQGSFPLDAAKKAAAAGIKIITIGFGDEAGSEIYVTDPEDGSRSLVRDADGNPVVSRLDGDLLREIALATDGAYVPAGTGVLDLASIYDTHIARLTRGQLDAHGRSIRGETYQLFVGAALLFVVLGAVVGSGGRTGAGGAVGITGSSASATTPSSRRPRAAARTRDFASTATLSVVFAVGALGAFGSANRAAGQTPGAGAPPPPVPAAVAPPAPATSPSASPSASPAPAPAEEDPRVRFNRANRALAEGDAALAGSLYRAARRDAVDDVELRYAASYNLGMAAVARADAVQATKPAEALAFLHEAADFFREAAAMRPDDDDPRHNLDVSLRRALILADEIARKGQRDVEGELDGLIEKQRARVAETAVLLEAAVRAGESASPETQAAPDAVDGLWSAFDKEATAVRELMADVEGLAERAANEKALLDTKPEAERAPEDGLRGASLDGVVGYLDQAVERMGQTRRQLRQRGAARAYRRASEALGLLKRARDQLRDPVEQIGVLLGEVAGVARATKTLAGGGAAGAAEGQGASAEAGGRAVARLPAFLTSESIELETRAVGARVGELAERFTRAADHAAEAAEAAKAKSAASAASDPDGMGASADDSTSSAAPTPPVDEKLVAALAQAAPLVASAHGALDRATAKLAEKKPGPALGADGEAMTALSEAQEVFFDLRQLLALSHETEARVAAIAASSDPAAVALRAKAEDELAETQRRNRARATRLESLLEDEQATRTAALEHPAPTPEKEAGGAAAAPDPAKAAAVAQLFERAHTLLGEAGQAMDEATAALGGGPAGRASDWARVAQAAGRSTERLEALQRLFLSLVEQLARLEREQVDLADRTREAIALAATERPAPPSSAATAPAERGPETRQRITAVDEEQKVLEQQAGAIADALLAQSEEAKRAAGSGGGDEASAAAGAAAAGGPDADTLRRAADQVATAQLAMQQASQTFGDAARPLPPAVESQGVARDALKKALELLSPPPPENPPEKPESGQDRKDSSGGDAGSPPPDQPKDEPKQEQNQDAKQDESKSEQGEGSPDQQAPSQPEPGEGEDAAAGASEDSSLQPPAGEDPGQLLQGIRDREAERRDANERKARRQRRSAPVEKDW